MTGSEFCEALRGGRRLYGTCIASDSPRWVEALPGTGIDCVFLDTEHVAQDRRGLSWMCQAFRAVGIVPLVRIPRPDHHDATMALDGGAAGVIVPYVETVEQVRALRGATKLRPLRGHRLAEIVEGAGSPDGELGEYLARGNAHHALIINVESTPALENLDALATEPGLDAILVGPHDLSCSLGVPERYDHPDFLSAVERIIVTARAHGLGVGVHAGHPGCEADQVRWARLGANLIMHGTDVKLFARKLQDDLAAIRAALEGSP